jgi:hypothetical protein
MTPEEKNAPLHSKAVGTIIIERLLALAEHLPPEQRHLRDQLRTLLKWISDPAAYGTSSAKKVTSHVSAEDLATMTKDDLIEKVPPHLLHLVKRWAKFFDVYEQKKHRRRGILWPKQTNDEITYECDIHLKSLLEQMGEMRIGDVAVTYDLTASFHQWLVDEAVQWYFCFCTETGDVYKFKRGVMGFSPMAELTDVATKVLAYSTLLSPKGTQVTTTTHIDNVRYMGSPHETEAAGHRFRKNCEYAGATWNVEQNNAVHSAGEFCGVKYDYNAGTTSAPPSILEKLNTYHDRFIRAPTYTSAAALFGVIFHVSAILRAPLADYYHVIKWYRKTMSRAAKLEPDGDAPVAFWASAKPQLQEWMRFLIANRPTSRPPDRITSGIKLFTDASDYGWGAVLILGDGVMRIVGNSWNPKERARDICERETMAVDNAATAFESWLRNTAFELYVDNTSAMWSIAKGYARAYHLNTRVGELRSTLKDLDARFTIHYVRSADNIADGPSRGNLAQLASPYVGRVGVSKEHLLPTSEKKYVEVAKVRAGRV